MRFILIWLNFYSYQLLAIFIDTFFVFFLFMFFFFFYFKDYLITLIILCTFNFVSNLFIFCWFFISYFYHRVNFNFRTSISSSFLTKKIIICTFCDSSDSTPIKRLNQISLWSIVFITCQRFSQFFLFAVIFPLTLYRALRVFLRFYFQRCWVIKIRLI